MNISEIYLYLPTFLATIILIALAAVAIAILPWSSKDFHKGQKEFQYVYNIIKAFLKEDMASFLAQCSTKNITANLTTTLTKDMTRVTRVTEVAEDITGIRRRAV